MNTLKAEKRNMQTKAKKLRREGYVTGNVFGREIEGSIPVQMTQKEAEKFLKANGKGSQIMLDLDGEQMDVLVKEVDYDSMGSKVLEIDFHTFWKVLLSLFVNWLASSPIGYSPAFFSVTLAFPLNVKSAAEYRLLASAPAHSTT